MHPKDGVVWQTGQEAPSANLMKISGGVRDDEDLRLNLSSLTGQEELQRLSEQKLAEQAREQEAARQQQNDGRAIVLPAEETVKLRPEELNPTKPEPLIPDSGVLASVRDSEQPDGRELLLADSVRKENAVPDKSSHEESRASRVVADLARAEQDMVRQTGDGGRGRMPEIEEQTLTRTIQKER
ncbi:hypothetical protein LVQ34_004823 [Escherichia coli]|nr:hypothetical protein [Escherichia coli]